MMHARVLGISLACVAFALGCATPDKYIPRDSGPDEATGGGPGGQDTGASEVGSGIPDGSSIDGLTSDAAGDAPVTGPDVPASAPDGQNGDMSSTKPDGPCGTPSDAHNCGTCGHDCTKLKNVLADAVSCVSGTCVVPPAACASGYAHCSSSPDDGCEAQLSMADNCGRCGMKCGAGELCASSAGSYQCVSSCGGSTPTKCGSTCVDLQTDGQNCGMCGHSCLGGTCDAGKCQAAQIYNGSDILPTTLALDSNYLYFKRDKGNGVSVVARTPKGGGQIIDLTSLDEGNERVAVVGGKLYWAKDDTLKGCSVPTCSSPFTIMNQTQAALAVTNTEGTQLFWLRRETGNNAFLGDVMTNPSNPTVIGTMDNNPIFLALSAVGSVAYVHADSNVSRASGGTGPVTVIDSNGASTLTANSRYVFVTSSDGAATPTLVQLRYSVAAIGTPQTPFEAGRYADFSSLYSVQADENNTYWLVGARGATRLLRCSVNGCGASPTELASVPGMPIEGWMVIDVDAFYWATSNGTFRLAR
jgi:hypothetical protein